jgi:cob(I)alamin adenosyltransferase
MTLKIYTRTGDRGDTGLFGGGRVGKDDVRVDAYGEVDELNAVVGVVRATAPASPISSLLEQVQRDLFSIGAILATPDLEKMRRQLDKARLDDARIAELERAIDAAEERLAPLKAFILPGGAPQAAALHVARPVCRRAERRVVHLAREVELPEMVIVYLNRLSDLLFTLARLANHESGTPDVEW